jgi:ACS family hexuronate transporter-like MFS transporter
MSQTKNLNGTVAQTDEVAPATESPAPDTRSAPDLVEHIGGFRWSICALLFFCTAINYIDRQVIGILKQPLSASLHWSENDYAGIVAFFQTAYAFGYLFGGRLMDRFGVKRALPGAALVWSAAEAAHGLIPKLVGAAGSVMGFKIARVGLGLAEGANFPAAIKAVGEWYPVKERALATGIFNSASNIGAIICPLTVPWIAGEWGWPAAFYATGALGVLWVIAWVLIYDSPEKHKSLSVPERLYIESGRPSASQTVAPTAPWLSLLKYRETWAYLIATMLTGPVWWFYLFWTPDFLQKRFHMTPKQAGIPVAEIYAISIIGSVAAGWLAGVLIGRGKSVNSARKISLLICALCVLPVFCAPLVTHIWMVVSVIGLAAAAHQGWSANLYTFASDTMGKRAVSSLVGFGGFASGLAGAGVAKVVGNILTTTGSYWYIFLWASTMYVLSVIILQLLVPKIAPVTELAGNSEQTVV